ncbi:MAG: hypothetical protein CO183_00070 [Candidatus Zambryskibacteria bacterium CG_4_9_14_3_um_filter_42_9]|uniref:Uncharacterized protein n=1 Tax=Candidatus Zambryskibacteria bacterium CG22_combo_CG10-13_8_21_14_all_42_17 TaxID=1975118 RepID=A0A2H0BDZ7_9BACT|nr:MAG: hypothetical protein COX06_01030 [Candidatus Zambryskibacteria bacterium CG22_combo_CG10-13_8_21_14_all_42_17]PJA37078.1 MAG: hypothetical protein CO183_00070 [Candidatus Zambryskibacteria bacterium CG_4_9_14_3_um_filter_42_9]
MTSITIFTISGLAIFILVAIKSLEEKRKQNFFAMGLISKWDKQTRRFYQRIIHLYSDGKERTALFFKRQIPMHSRNLFNKLVYFLKGQREFYFGNIRDSRLLKKPDGISEFFKNMSKVEKGNGEINDTYRDSFQNEEKRIK